MIGRSPQLERLNTLWAAKILPVVRDKIADAHAHGLNAITAALKDTTNGRSSILRINRSPSYKAAQERLRELWIALAGGSEVSLDGSIRDAREAFYRLAFAIHLPTVPIEYRRTPDPEPTQYDIRVIRAAAIHGYDPSKELQVVINRLSVGLKAALHQAGMQSTPDKVEDQILKAWEKKAAKTVTNLVLRLLSDSMVYADTEAGIDILDPAKYDRTPVAIGA